MCKPISGYVAHVGQEVKVWIDEQIDSHSELAEKYNLRDNSTAVAVRLYAFEFTLPSTPTPDLANWNLNWDSDATAGCREKPSDDDAADFRAAIERAASRFVRVGGEWHSNDRAFYFGNAQIHQPSGGEQCAFDNAQIHQPSGGDQRALDNAQIHQPSGGKQRACNNAQIHQPSGGKQIAFDNARIHHSDCDS